MTMGNGLPMIMEKGVRVAGRLTVVYRSVVGDGLMLSIVIRVRFVHKFRLN